MRSTSLRRSTHITLLCLFVLGALIPFSINLNNYFLSDDFAQIGRVLSRNYSVTWGREYGGFFRPLFIWTYILDSSIGGAHPLGYHLTNVIVHGLNSLLVFHFGRALLSDQESQLRSAVSIGAAVLFLLHPSHTEAVSWISGRADLFATLFVLLSLCLLWKYLRNQRAWLLIFSLLSFAFALLAKESAIFLPLLLLVLGWDAAENRQLLIKIFFCFVAVLVAFIALRSYAIGSVVGGYGAGQHLNFSPGWIRDRLLEASIRSLLPALPDKWSSFLFKPLQSPLFYLIVVVVLAIATAAIVNRRKWHNTSKRRTQNRLLIGLALSFLVSLLPVISLRLSLYETLGERFLYLPSVFAVLIVAYLASILTRHWRISMLILICIACFYSISLYRTMRVWREASLITLRAKDEIVASATSEHVLILNAPDNLRGVPVFHNGLPEALQFFQHEKSIRDVQIVSFMRLDQPNDSIEIDSVGDAITVRTLRPSDRLERVAATNCMDITKSQFSFLKLRRKPCASMDTFFFSAGSMNKLVH